MRLYDSILLCFHNIALLGLQNKSKLQRYLCKRTKLSQEPKKETKEIDSIEFGTKSDEMLYLNK